MNMTNKLARSCCFILLFGATAVVVWPSSQGAGVARAGQLRQQVAITVDDLPGAIPATPAASGDLRDLVRYNACSPRTNEVLRREMPRVLAGFATCWQFFTRVYTHLHVGQDVWQTDIQGLQQITAGRIRHGDAQASTALFDFHFRRTQRLQLL